MSLGKVTEGDGADSSVAASGSGGKNGKSAGGKTASASAKAASGTAKPGGKASGATPTDPKNLDPEILERIAQVRAKLRENFGAVVMTMMALPRYRSQTLADISHLVLDPLMRDRIAMAWPARPAKDDNPLADMAGLAIWASVSEEVDARIREQIKGGVFPVRLKPEDWTSGNINWLLDVIAPDSKTAASVIGNFKQIIKDGDLRMHPVIGRLLDAETLEKMGARKMSGGENG